MTGVAPAGARACPSQRVENETLGSQVVEYEYSVVEASECVVIQLEAMLFCWELLALVYMMPERQHV